MYGVSKCKNKRCGVYHIIIEEKSYAFENPKTAFIRNRNLCWNSKNVVDIIKCTNCNKSYTKCTQILNNKSNFKLPGK